MRPALRVLVLVVGTVSVAISAAASFYASDLIYIPAVAHNEGENGSVWRTDLYITNVDEVDIDVMMVYLPSGLQNNSLVFTDRSLWLGGRESDGVGFVNEALADIPPNATVVLEDVIGEYWIDELSLTGLGAMVVFAYESGSLEDDGSRVFRNAVVMSRTYNQTTVYQPDPDNEGQFLEVPATYGQGVPGVPWYNLADPAAVSEEADLSFFDLVGVFDDEDFRFNLGILNASDPQTQIALRIQPFQPNGEPYLDDEGNPKTTLVTLPPLAHVQYNRILATNFELENVAGITVRVAFLGWTSNSADPTPAMTAYGSVGDNVTSDATTVLPAFASPYEVDRVWPTAKRAPTVTARPLRVPPRGRSTD